MTLLRSKNCPTHQRGVVSFGVLGQVYNLNSQTFSNFSRLPSAKHSLLCSQSYLAVKYRRLSSVGPLYCLLLHTQAALSVTSIPAVVNAVNQGISRHMPSPQGYRARSPTAAMALSEFLQRLTPPSKYFIFDDASGLDLDDRPASAFPSAYFSMYPRETARSFTIWTSQRSLQVLRQLHDDCRADRHSTN